MPVLPVRLLLLLLPGALCAQMPTSRDTVLTEYVYSPVPPNKFPHEECTSDDSAALVDDLRALQAPDSNNYRDYYELATRLWEFGWTTEAQRMFLTILESKEPYYCSTTWNGATKDSNGRFLLPYGSYQTNYKNGACTQLAEIAIEQEAYAAGLNYVIMARDRYPVAYTCGTGHRMYNEVLEKREILCLEGMQLCDSVIGRLLPFYGSWDNDPLIRCLRKKYTKAQLVRELDKAMRSIRLTDTSSHIAHVYEQDDRVGKEVIYAIANGNMVLFGKEIKISTVRPLEESRFPDRSSLVKEFRASSFYMELSGDLSGSPLLLNGK